MTRRTQNAFDAAVADLLDTIMPNSSERLPNCSRDQLRVIAKAYRGAGRTLQTAVEIIETTLLARRQDHAA
jgi:hypothetical protein